MTSPDELISNYFNSTLSEEDEKLLHAHLLENPKNAQAFMQAAMLHNNLRDYFHSQATTHIHTPSHASPAKTSRWKLPLALSAIAASLALLITLSLYYRWQQSPVATLARSISATWSSAPLIDGQPVSHRLLELRSGLAEFSFPSGATVLLQGPASFRLQSPTSILLYAGRLTTDIPQPAIGFTVITPTASIIDLGTQVGISVSPANAHIEVFKGKAGIRLNQTPANLPLDRILTANNAIDINPDTQSLQPADLHPFLFTRVDDLHLSPSALAQLFTTRLHADPSLLASYAFDAKDEATSQLANHSLATANQFNAPCLSTTWTPGPTPGSRALAFNGINSRALLNITTPAPALSITAWVNSARFDKPYAALLMSDGATRIDSCHFQFANLNNHPTIIFSTPAPDHPVPWYNFHFPVPDLATNLNSWRFVALVYNPAAFTCSCYLDGELIDTRPIPSPTPITIGSAQIGNWNGTDAQSSRGAFHGSLTNLNLFKRPLAPEEIDALYNAQKPQAAP